ncbi:MAG: beta-ribofuranosylaminobenzene 5'-phosphate synthase [Planctomycetaceae bacterium]|jgi:beta-ribofuranosylaminobenzene 5'-phosphate synthase
MTQDREVTVSTGSRLHFGLLTHRPKSGREFGGVGVMIDSPGWTVTASAANDVSGSASDRIVVADSAAAACPETESRVSRIVERFRQIPDANIPALKINVTSAIPSHCGLGSGTQLALATARAINDCLDLGQASAGELAELTGRGLRSAVGTWGFESGGLIVDGGKLGSDPVGSMAARLEFPSDWRFLLIFPQNFSGLSGDEEVTAFRDLPGMPQETTDALCRLTVMEILPAIQSQDFNRAAAALAEYGFQAGEYFAPAQGGVFIDPRMQGFSRLLAENGIKGFAQTSWGPTCAALCSDDEVAEQAVEIIKSSAEGSHYQFAIAHPLNRGATVEISESSGH